MSSMDAECIRSPQDRIIILPDKNQSLINLDSDHAIPDKTLAGIFYV
jgi:hypothetical protein